MNTIQAISGSDQAEQSLFFISAKNGPNSVSIAVLGSGLGVDEAVLARLHHAFYTTKPDGMGVDLTISRTIIETHGRQLRTMPHSPNGAKFEFEIPIDPHEAP